jgi:hypothetical protein
MEVNAAQATGIYTPAPTEPYELFLKQAQQFQHPGKGCNVTVYSGDWGEVCQALTVVNGKRFAVLNMANAFVKGGGYWDGMPAQEENMWRRSDCHYFEQLNPKEQAGYYPTPHPLQGGVAHVDRIARVCTLLGACPRMMGGGGVGWLILDRTYCLA